MTGLDERNAVTGLVKKVSWEKREAETTVAAGALKTPTTQFGSCAGTGGCDQFYIERDSGVT